MTNIVEVVNELKTEYNKPIYDKYKNNSDFIGMNDIGIKYDLTKQAEIAAHKITSVYWKNKKNSCLLGILSTNLVL